MRQLPACARRPLPQAHHQRGTAFCMRAMQAAPRQGGPSAECIKGVARGVACANATLDGSTTCLLQALPCIPQHATCLLSPG